MVFAKVHSADNAPLGAELTLSATVAGPFQPFGEAGAIEGWHSLIILAADTVEKIMRVPQSGLSAQTDGATGRLVWQHANSIEPLSPKNAVHRAS
jgi:hypothetical protein